MTICLSMIVKDEAPVIRRCLQSVRPLIDTWCIVDTGSTDGTQDLIRKELNDFPDGVLYQRPWVDFATNRTEALELAKGMADYTFVMDADDTLDQPPRITGLSADAYTATFKNSGSIYHRVQLVKSSLPWRYRGVVHEFLECPEPWQSQDLPLVIQCGHDSARALDPEKYVKDAAILEAALDSETDPFLRSRYGFYLAQSYRDCGQTAKALFWYGWRADQGHWIEEVYVSLLNAARLAEQLEPERAIGLYLQAIDAVPGRAEAYHGAAHLCRMKSQYRQGYEIAQRAVELAKPHGGLFVEEWIYDWGLLDELSVSAYWCGEYRASLDAAELIYSEGKCHDMARIAVNANFARRKLLLRGGV